MAPTHTRRRHLASHRRQPAIPPPAEDHRGKLHGMLPRVPLATPEASRCRLMQRPLVILMSG
ncbi:hypothetical protein [Cruoricaptor ignavus]|uniref:hypothetical protein n=1 Tax=Cruoricaptor ignavus TaxID=1118202 RepID=UPI001160B2B4|nr:hypothetical protein [Cruoricaptor ignavus]